MAKCDNIEQYSLRTLFELKNTYDTFIKNAGCDPDFPNLPMGDSNDNSISLSKENNKLSSLMDDDSSEPPSKTD